MLAVFIFHCTRFFDTEGWHVKNSRQSDILFVLVRGLFWPWMMELFFLLSGAGSWYLNFNHKILAYGNEAVLPFYLFHQTIILIVGFFVIRWNIGILPKFLIVAVISFPLILVLYELPVKPFNAVRFFFGMRPRKRLEK